MVFLSRALALNPTGLAVDDGQRRWSYTDLNRHAEEVAGRLKTLGVTEGDVIGLAGQVDATVLAALHGIWRTGARPAPLNPAWTLEEAGRALELLQPRYVLLGPPSAGLAGQAWPSGPGEAFSLAPDPGSHLPSLDGVQVAPDAHQRSGSGAGGALLLTSGTSGRPNIVELTSRNLESSAEASGRRLGLRPGDRWLFSLSLAHVGGLAMATRAAYLGSTLMLRGSFQVEEFLQLAAKGSVTHASLVPTMLHHSLEEWGGRKAPSSLECLLVGGAEAHAGLIARALATNFPLALTYGLTQASSQVTTAPPALVRRKPGTVGPPLKGVDVRLAPNGEILVRGPTVAPGEIAPDGWLHTGDLAREDADGDLWITGRLSHRIISGGMNVDPAEVEAVLLRYPGVREAAVVGLSDPEWGERVAAAIVWVEAGKADLAGVERFVREVLSKGKRPRVMRSVAELPRNPNGKVDRDRIRSLFR